MKAIFNTRTVSIEEIKLPMNNRAFLYGDSIFETLLCHKGTPLRFHLHLNRLINASRVLGFNFKISGSELESICRNLLIQNGHTETARLKMQVWRKPGGLYQPQTNECNFLITSEAYSWNGLGFKEKAGLAEGISTCPSVFSQFKTGSALLYVMAGIQKKEKGLDELLLCDPFGNLAEASASNIFWVLGGKIYTPSLKTGCLAGIKRAWLLDAWRKMSIEVLEVESPVSVLQKVDFLFTTNATGNACILSLGEKKFQKPDVQNPPVWIRPLLEM